jgi:hypothetical protein
MKDFFISYTKADQAWAEWIAWQLENLGGYTTVIQAWDFHAGSNFISEMQKAAVETHCTIAVLSPAFLTSPFTEAEWTSAFASDPTGAMECGWMRAMGKNVLYLVENNFDHRRGDWQGLLEDRFSWEKPDIGIRKAIHKWLA